MPDISIGAGHARDHAALLDQRQRVGVVMALGSNGMRRLRKKPVERGLILRNQGLVDRAPLEAQHNRAVPINQ